MDNFCVAFIYSIKRAREIRKFLVVVVQRRQRNVQNSVNINILLDADLLAVAVVVCFVVIQK